MSQNRPLYVTFFTPPYADEAARLVRTMDVVGLEYLCKAMPDRGGRMANSAHVPTFVRNAMLACGDRPIVWLDADSRVRREPLVINDLPDASYDFAAVWDGDKPYTSILYFANSRPSWELVRAWEALVKDGKPIAAALTEATDRIKGHMAGLPESYRVLPSWSAIKQAVFEHVGITRLLLPAPSGT